MDKAEEAQDSETEYLILQLKSRHHFSDFLGPLASTFANKTTITYELMRLLEAATSTS